ncbi:MAG: phosphoenolpyruvate--protein phosphotransferase [Oscillospiraceae bacterium]
MVKLTGFSGAPGFGAGDAFLLRRGALAVTPIPVADPREEVAILTDARARYLHQLALLSNEAHAGENDAAAAIFEGYRAMADDPYFWTPVEELISTRSVCASYAIEQRRLETVTAFLAAEDDFLRARAADVTNVCREVMAELQGVEGAVLLPPEGNRLVVFARELSPADIARLSSQRLAGIVTETGGTTSHTAILAQALGVPAVVGTGAFPKDLTEGTPVLVDGDAGEVLLRPDASQVSIFMQKLGSSRRRQVLFDACRGEPAVTRDGNTVRVCVNSGDKESVDSFDPALCDGIGLFRTEFLYLAQKDYPSEDLQYEAYRSMAEKAAGKELIIRTLDSGGDKQLPYMDLPREDNPFLGYRAIRLCLDRPELFKTQLRAILRAGTEGDVKLMFPMLVNLEELLRAKELLAEAMAELEARGVPYRRDLPVGMMVETPAAVLLSDQFAKHVSFFSIGSNDLIQYTTAADRTNQRMGALYDSCNLSVLRSVRLVCQNAHAAGIPVGICGETASEPRLIPLWCAMGVDELSVAPALVGRTKYLLRCLSRRDLQPELDAVLEQGSVPAVKERLARILAELPV